MGANYLIVRTGIALRRNDESGPPENGDVYYDGESFKFCHDGRWIDVSFATPFWKRFEVALESFDKALFSHSSDSWEIELTTLPRRTVVHQAAMVVEEPFAGDGVSECWVSVGTPSDPLRFIPSLDGTAGEGSPTFAHTQLEQLESETEATKVILQAHLGSSLPTQLRRGQLVVWLLTSELP